MNSAYKKYTSCRSRIRSRFRVSLLVVDDGYAVVSRMRVVQIAPLNIEQQTTAMEEIITTLNVENIKSSANTVESHSIGFCISLLRPIHAERK